MLCRVRCRRRWQRFLCVWMAPFVGCDYSVIYQCNMMKQALIKNFWRVGNNGDRNLYDVDLGWNLSAQKDAGSYCAEKIFRYYVEDVGLNILFLVGG